MKTKKLFIAVSIILAFIAIPEIAISADPKMTGKWVFEIQDINKVINPIFILNQDGTNLSGKYHGRFGEADVTGRVRGIEVEMAFTDTTGARNFYSGTVDGDRIRGKANFNGMMIIDFTGEKQ